MFQECLVDLLRRIQMKPFGHLVLIGTGTVIGLVQTLQGPGVRGAAAGGDGTQSGKAPDTDPTTEINAALLRSAPIDGRAWARAK
jgi:hypothetical protein